MDNTRSPNRCFLQRVWRSASQSDRRLARCEGLSRAVDNREGVDDGRAAANPRRSSQSVIRGCRYVGNPDKKKAADLSVRGSGFSERFPVSGARHTVLLDSPCS